MTDAKRTGSNRWNKMKEDAKRTGSSMWDKMKEDAKRTGFAGQNKLVDFAEDLRKEVPIDNSFTFHSNSNKYNVKVVDIFKRPLLSISKMFVSFVIPKNISEPKTILKTKCYRVD